MGEPKVLNYLTIYWEDLLYRLVGFLVGGGFHSGLYIRWAELTMGGDE